MIKASRSPARSRSAASPAASASAAMSPSPSPNASRISKASTRVPEPSRSSETRLPRKSATVWIPALRRTTTCTASGNRLATARSFLIGPVFAKTPLPL
jgi:hypothetical protein